MCTTTYYHVQGNNVQLFTITCNLNEIEVEKKKSIFIKRVLKLPLALFELAILFASDLKMPPFPWDVLKAETLRATCKELGASPATRRKRDMILFLKDVETLGRTCSLSTRFIYQILKSYNISSVICITRR